MLKQHKATPGWLPSPTGLPCWAAGQYSTAPLAKAPSGQPRPDVHLCPQLPPLPWVNSALKHLVTRSLKLGEAPPSSPTSKASPFHGSHVCVFVWGEGKLFIFICLMLISVNTKKKKTVSQAQGVSFWCQAWQCPAWRVRFSPDQETRKLWFLSTQLWNYASSNLHIHLISSPTCLRSQDTTKEAFMLY